jgi:hypothetical protein
MNNLAVILYYLLIISICGKSININMNKITILQHKLRNTSLRVIVFNDIYKNIREKSLELLNSYNELIISKSSLFTSCFYDLTYKYYSMEEIDRDNLELIINLLC